MRAQQVIGAIGAALSALALTLGASGCGAGAGAVLDPVAQAADATSHAGGAHLSFSGQISGAGLASPVTLGGSGVFNYATQEGSLTLDISGLPASAGLPAGALRAEEVFKGTTIYLASPLLGGRLPGGARWVKLDVAKSAAALGLNLQQLTSGQSNPAQFLEYLKASGGAATVVGHDGIRGVPATHYRDTIDLRKLVARLPSADRAAASAGLSKLFAQAGLSNIPFDAWVDAQHLVRRMQVSLSLRPNGQPLAFAINVELFGFGPTAPVAAPAPGEVFDATGSVLHGLASSGG